MCGMGLVFLILPTLESGSLVGLQNKTFCHQASWKVSKLTAMRFGIWTRLGGSTVSCAANRPFPCASHFCDPQH
jgi:hypothetical protein